MVIAYQPEAEIREIRKVQGWQVLPPLPTEILRPAPCADEVSAWLSGKWVQAYVKSASPNYVAVAAPVRPATLQERFLEQADKWEQETKFVSSLTKRITHPSYQAILGMGKEPGIVKILLRDLQKNRRPWFLALSYITQENPINPEDAGKMDKMIAAWVNWGRARQLL